MSQKKELTAQDYLQKAGNVSLEYLSIFKNKLATTMVDTVYMAENITKQVLPGNPVTREYEVVRHIGSAGPGLLWRLYAGYKKSTKQEACVFVLQKKSLESYSKRDRDQIVDAFKKGATQLARIKHPRILSLQHQLEESKDSLAFATEPCFCSLANALGDHENMPAPLPPEFSDYKLFEVEIKYGLMQIAEALHFLHKDVKILHRNIWPGSIIINSNGAWKLAGFEMFVANCNDPNDPIRFPFKEWDGSVALVLNPELDYLAPEYGLTSKCDSASDMFSYGMLFYTSFNNGKSLYDSKYSYSAFINNVEELRKMTNSQFGSIPSDVREYLKLLMHINPELRPDAGQVMKIPFFDDVAVKTLEYLDSSFQVDNLQKSIFFKSLPQIIDKLPQRVCLQRIIPCLEQEFINPDMIPFLLPNIFLIAQQSSNEEYVKYILPRLKIIFKIQKPIQILLIVLRNMGLILSKTPPTEIKEHILPMVCRSLEADTIEIQELCLSSLPTFANMLDTQSIKLQLIPRIRKLCLESSSMSVRLNSLICVGKLLDFLEKWVVLDDILPILEKITVRDSGVLMAMLGIYKVALTHPKLGITKDILATRVLPSIMPILIDGNLNMKQFDAYMKVTKEMLAQIESEQKRKLEQIEALEREKSIIPYAMANSNASKPAEVYKGPETMMDQLMSGYGLNQQPNNGNAPPPGYQGNAIMGDPSNTSPNRSGLPKKPMTLSEKQEMASRIEKEFESASSSKSALSPSMSLSTIKKPPVSPTSNTDLLTDSLVDRNLANLNMSSNKNNQFSGGNGGNMNIMMNKSTSGGFNQFNNGGQMRPAMNNNQSSMMTMNQQMGFFGNLALPAPPTSSGGNNSSGNMSLNSMSSMMTSSMMSNQQQQQQQPPHVMTPSLLPPPPGAANRVQLMGSAQQANNNASAGGKKTALDDLQDIFG